MDLIKTICKISFAFLLCVLFSQCISKKKHLSKISVYEKRLTSLKNDSVSTHDHLARIKQDSALMQTQLNSYKEKTEGSTAPLTRAKKPRTISEEKEYDDMVSFIYNITKYVEWPTEVKGETFRIGILGKSKLQEVLRSKLLNKKNENQKFEIQEFSSIKQIKDCEVLVISRNNPNSISAIKSKVGKFPTLFLTEGEDYIKSGVHVNLRVEGDEVKMAVNKEAVKSAKFKVSKTLLSLSEK